MKKNILIALLVVIFSLFATKQLSVVIFAQETSAEQMEVKVIDENKTTQELEPGEGSIREQETTIQQQTQLQTTYRAQLENYRTKEKSFSVAQEQLFNLNTLAALEEAVQATKQMMIARDQVLQTYFQLLRLKLIDSHGIPLADKALVMEQLVQLEQGLKTHEQEVTQVTDRFTLAQSSQNFTLLADKFETIINQALCLITYGGLQTVYDKTVALIPEVESKFQGTSQDFDLAKKERAIKEVKLLSENTSSLLKAIYQEFFITKDGKTKTFTDSDLTQLSSKLQPVYAQINQMHEFIDEVTKI